MTSEEPPKKKFAPDTCSPPEEDGATADPEEMDYSNCPPNPDDIALIKAAADGKLEEVQRLLRETEADPCYQDLGTGMSVLMAASGAGHITIVCLLLEEGAPWNAVDRRYLSAGDYAVRNGHQNIVDCIMNHAVMAEFILGTVLRNERKSENANYLAQSLEYTPKGDKLLDADGLAVMMDWEKPLMKSHADFVCGGGSAEGDGCGAILNVGFGMGIVDEEIQTHRPREHVIIEAHPQVYARMLASGWDKKPGVRIVHARWQDIIDALGPFDGVFFDTYAEDDFDLKQFHQHLDHLLIPHTGRYSFYNGMCPDNVFFHGVACEVVRLQLKSIGFSCEYEPVKVDVADPKIWEGVTSRYWHFDTYYLPKCVRENSSAPSAAPRQK